jgi:hypothetical protein
LRANFDISSRTDLWLLENDRCNMKGYGFLVLGLASSHASRIVSSERTESYY